jgi:transposase
MSQLNQYVGLDVSLKGTSISVIDEADKTIWRGRSASTPDDIAEKLVARAPNAVRIGLECRQLSNWLYQGLKSKGLPVICIGARHASATLSLRINKTDANDAQRLAQLMRVGWYRETTVKGIDCRYVRSLLVVRQRLVSQITALKNCVRGVIKGFGRVMPKALKRHFVPKIRAIRRDAAPGVDGETWADYEQDLDRRIEALHSAIHSGAYCQRQCKTDPGGNMKLTHRIRWFLLSGGADAEGGGTNGIGGFEEAWRKHSVALAVDGSITQYGAALSSGW